MQDTKKAITVSFVATGLLVGFVCHLLFQFLAQSLTVFSRIEGNELWSNLLPVFLGAVTFLVLQFNRRSVTFMEGVVNELAKVVWPTRKETALMTVVVVVTLIFTGVVIGLYDTIAAYLINFFIK